MFAFGKEGVSGMVATRVGTSDLRQVVLSSVPTVWTVE